jgi:hypothetical protein
LVDLQVREAPENIGKGHTSPPNGRLRLGTRARCLCALAVGAGPAMVRECLPVDASSHFPGFPLPGPVRRSPGSGAG